MTTNAQDFGTTIPSNTGSLLESVNKVLYNIADRDTWVLKRFLKLTPDTPVVSFHHCWINRPLVGFKDTLNANINNSTTSVVVKSGTSTDPKRYIANQTIIDIEDERMLVTAVSISTTTTTLTVTRAVDGTTAAAHNANAQVLIVSAPPAEGADISRDDSQKGVRVENYTQIFQRALQLSGTSQAVKTVGNENMLSLQARDLIAEIMKELQFTMLHGWRYIDNTNTVRRMGGLKWFAATAGGGGTTTNKGGQLLSAGMIESAIEQYLNLGGDGNKMLMLCSVKQQRMINQLKLARVINGGMTQSEKTLNDMVEAFDFGDRAKVDIMYCTDLRDDELYFLQEDKLEVKPLN